jgi:heme exporter protein D
MSALGHWHYVAFAYGAAILVMAGLILAVLLDHRAQKRALAQLEARGVRRRAAAPAPAAAVVRAEASR